MARQIPTVVLMTLTFFLMVPDDALAQCEADSAGWRSIGLENAGESINDIAVHPDSSGHILAATSSTVYWTENCGDSWSKISIMDSSFSQVEINGSAPDTMLVLGNRLFRSMNGGDSWSAVDQGISLTGKHRICDLAVPADSSSWDYIYAGVCGSSSGALYRSEDIGGSWVQIQDTAEQRLQSSVTQLDLERGTTRHLYIGTDSSSLLYTADAGTSWYEVEMDTGMTGLRQIEGSNHHAFLLSGDRVIQSVQVSHDRNNGYSTDTVMTMSVPETVTKVNELSYGAFYNCGQYLHMSTDNGIYRQAVLILTHPCFEGPTEWVKTGTGLSHENINTHAFAPKRIGDHGGSNPYSFVGLQNKEGQSGVYIRATTQEFTAIEGPSDRPAQFTLQQNYPNPFNPTTKIEYHLRSATKVTLAVYNLLGQRIKVLEKATKPAGTYTATFKAGGLSSGIYIYKLQTPSYSQSRKMLLLK